MPGAIPFSIWRSCLVNAMCVVSFAALISRTRHAQTWLAASVPGSRRHRVERVYAKDSCRASHERPDQPPASSVP